MSNKYSKTIVIDPGHGGEDNGAAYGFVEEDDTNLSIAYLLRAELVQCGCNVLLTREKDVAVSLRARCNFANEQNAGLFVSIHCDAFHQESASGMSVHIHPECGEITRTVAERIRLMLMMDFPGHTQRGIRQSNFSVLRHTKMPAVLIECEFLSNAETRDFLHEPENQLALARTIAKGIRLANNGRE